MKRVSIFIIALFFVHAALAGLTPFGYVPDHCVHKAENGEVKQLDDGSLVLRSGNTYKVVPPCNVNWLRPRNATLPNGWTAYTEWQSNGGVNVFNGYWPVPSNPVQEDLQTLFLFTGLQNEYFSGVSQAVTIIQPVLQWGPSDAGGGSYWSIASWYVGGGNAVYSKLQQVASGDKIVGNMTLSGSKWNLVAHDANSGVDSDLSVSTGVQELYAFVTLEVYGVKSCGDFPNGSTTFANLYIESNSNKVTPQWTPNSQDECSEAVNIVNPSTVTLKF